MALTFVASNGGGIGIGCFRRTLQANKCTSSKTMKVSRRNLHSTTSPMMVSKGDRIPSDASFMQMIDGAPSSVKASDIFSGKRVAVFTVPGALTGTCLNSHARDWLAAHDSIKAKGIDDIACIAVNDPFVMDAFKVALNADGKIDFYGDGDASFTKAIGIDVDTGAFGGVRAVRGSYVIDDGVFTHVNLENGTGYEGPAKPDTVLEQI